MTAVRTRKAGYHISTVIMFGVAVIACHLPAMRAVRVYPMVALRPE
jgi:ABC-type lipoprotein release transport system permease subunit